MPINVSDIQLERRALPKSYVNCGDTVTVVLDPSHQALKAAAEYLGRHPRQPKLFWVRLLASRDLVLVNRTEILV